MRRWKSPSFWTALLLGLAIFWCESRAIAASKHEAKALQLQKAAMEEDYLATDFKEAEQKLTRAIGFCGDDNKKCSKSTRAKLRRDLGVVKIGGQNDSKGGEAAFVEALKIDPKVSLDPDLKTKAIEDAWAAAIKSAGVNASGGDDGDGGEDPEGDFDHSSLEAGLVRTPMPIFVAYEGEGEIVRVKVRYKAFGMSKWKPLSLKKMKDGWGAYIPCEDALQGELQYFIQGFDKDNDPIASAGSRKDPFKVQIKDKIGGDPPALPGEKAPKQCADKGDCPPGFPCDKSGGGTGGGATGGLGEGEECVDSWECKSGKCDGGKCTKPEDASSGPKKPKFYIGASFGLDYTLLPSGDDVCKLGPDKTPTNDSGYYCVNDDGTDYPLRTDRLQQNGLLQPGRAGSVNGGGAVGNIRILLSFDYALNANMLVGGRLGFVANRYPGEEAGIDGVGFALPIHAEARFTYLFGQDALYEKTIAPYAFGSLGLSQTDAAVAVPITETGSPPSEKTAYAIGGPLFVGAGGGVRIGVGKDKRVGIMVAPLRANLALGGGATLISLSPELGVHVGF